MPETPADTLRRAAAAIRDAAQTTDNKPERHCLLAVAVLLEQIAGYMTAAEAFECKPMGIVTSEDDGYRSDWTAALAVARAYLGEADAPARPT